MDGARQIVTPAFVSLLCICIVFVPMFFLDGVARFLFVPMAEAVMFAMICSFILSRTLVPTMANYLLKPHTAARARREAAHAQSAGAVPARLRGAVRALPRGLSRPAGDGARPPRRLHHRLHGVRAGLVRAGADARPQLLPGGRCRPDPDARPRAGRHARRGIGQPVRRHPEGDPRDPARGRDRDDGRQRRHAGQRHQHDLQQHRRDRPAGRRHPDQAGRGPRPDRQVRRRAAQAAARALPRLHLLVPAGRHHQPDPEFRRAVADRRPGADHRPGGRLRACQPAAGPHPHHPRRGRCAHPAGAQRAGLRRRYRPQRAPSMSASPRATSPTRWWSISRARARWRRPTGSTRPTASPTTS